MTRGARLAALPAGRVTKWIVIGGWLVLLAVLGPLAGKLSDVQKNEASSFLPPKAESTTVLNELTAFQPRQSVPTVIVYERPGGVTAADRAYVDAQRQAMLATGVVVGGEKAVPPASLSKDGAALELIVPVVSNPKGFQVVDDVTAIKNLARSHDGLTAYVGGPGGQLLDQLKAFQGIDGVLLVVTVVVVVVVLLITYRSPFLWLLPVIGAGGALTVAQAVTYLLAAHAGLTVNGQSQGILLVLVFGAGTDYALLLVARYREELHRHRDKHEAMALALRRAAPAILASGTTVILALLCLLFSELNANRGLGPVSAIGIASALAAMLTLLPAVLAAVPRRTFWPRVPVFGTDPHEESGVFARLGRGISRRPRVTWVSASLVLAVLAVGVVQLNANGLSGKGIFRGNPPSVRADAVVARHFEAGAGNPAQIIGAAADASEMATAARSVKGVAAVSPPVVLGGRALVEAELSDDPLSQRAFATVERLRAAEHAVAGADAKVGGNTAINLDVQSASKHDRLVIIPIVLLVVLGVLVVVLRAVVAPLLLVATVVLSFFATLGACGLAFRHAFGFEGADSSFPLFAFIFLVALGIDYNIFLMTRAREESHLLGTRAGTLKALAVTGGVITSAGVVLAATFTTLGILPLVSLTEVGFAVAFGVLLDTLVVRSVIVPALVYDAHRWVWWPSGRRATAPPSAQPVAQQAAPPR